MLIRHSLSLQFADDHEKQILLFMTAMENEWPKFQKYSPHMILFKYTSPMQEYYAKSIAFVEDSSYLRKGLAKIYSGTTSGTHVNSKVCNQTFSWWIPSLDFIAR